MSNRVIQSSRFLLILILAAAGLRAESSAPGDAREIVRRSVERDWTDFESRRNYTYEQLLETRDLARDGSVTHTKSETREMLVLNGRPYERVIARDGKPLTPSETRREQEKLDREAERRMHETPAEQAKWAKERDEERRYIREIPEAFDFKLLGSENVSGRPAWVIDAEPKPGYRPALSQARIFTKVRAKIWIEQATYHWVKMDAVALDTLTFGFGLVRVAPGGTLHFEQTRVNDEIWLPARAVIRADARLALIKKLRAEFDVTYRGYKKFQTDSRIVGAGEN